MMTPTLNTLLAELRMKLSRMCVSLAPRIFTAPFEA